jgi:hypothetical protein
VAFLLKTRKNVLAITALTMLLVLLLGASSVGQVRHNRVRSDMAPGLAAERFRKADPDLARVSQPVRIVAPAETTIDVLSNESVLTTSQSKVTMGLAVGPVYQVKISGLNLYESVELYPSIELLGRLYPPKGMQNRFPIEIAITRDDLLQVIDGSMVTKVIYLEHGDMVVPHRHSPDQQPTFDVGANEDPLRASETLGRPMAILRIGSRVPLNGNPADTIRTIGPAPILLSEPVQFSLGDQPSRPALPHAGGFKASFQTDQTRSQDLPPVVTTNRSVDTSANVLSNHNRN